MRLCRRRECQRCVLLLRPGNVAPCHPSPHAGDLTTCMPQPNATAARPQQIWGPEHAAMHDVRANGPETIPGDLGMLR
eukprot:353304-Chlamydomonas_euryale.AAC.12